MVRKVAPRKRKNFQSEKNTPQRKVLKLQHDEAENPLNKILILTMSSPKLMNKITIRRVPGILTDSMNKLKN
ncbi:uncharacterized protein [Bemisia tabaci]|uniref:uncharacterized protein isoform X2 n=1 Tax=Bemisia tabaci TaxID=7038 RepID=UPI003B27EF9D